MKSSLNRLHSSGDIKLYTFQNVSFSLQSSLISYCCQPFRKHLSSSTHKFIENMHLGILSSFPDTFISTIQSSEPCFYCLILVDGFGVSIQLAKLEEKIYIL